MCRCMQGLTPHDIIDIMNTFIEVPNRYDTMLANHFLLVINKDLLIPQPNEDNQFSDLSYALPILRAAVHHHNL